MPVFKSGKSQAPGWCTLEFFEIVELKPRETRDFKRVGKKEKIIILKGECRLGIAEAEEDALRSALRAPKLPPVTKLSLDTPEGRFVATDVTSPAKLLRVAGRWKGECPAFGKFTPAKRVPPRDKGDAFDYPKTNGMDNHFHDCDEYWIVYEGRGVAYSEGKRYEVGPGDCIATGLGHHHDFPEDIEPVKAVYLETDLEEQKRHGHLWEYKHGKAKPQKDRI